MGAAIGCCRSKYRRTADEEANVNFINGKNFIVTGGNSGIGFETCRVLVDSGGFVILCCRNDKDGQSAVASIKKSTGKKTIVHMVLDLADLGSIEKFVAAFNALDIPLHVLINNAGVMLCPYMLTKDGLELQTGTNHVGHFHLTSLLIPKLKETSKPDSPSRIVNISSAAHRNASRPFVPKEHINIDQSKYSSLTQYGNSKIANMLFTVELDKRYRKDNIVSFSLHPGVIVTNLGRHINSWLFGGFASIFHVCLKSIPQGAATTLYCATSEEPVAKKLSGKFFFNSQLQDAERSDALDSTLAADLWAHTEDLITQIKKSK